MTVSLNINLSIINSSNEKKSQWERDRVVVYICISGDTLVGKMRPIKQKRVKWLWHVGALIPQLAYHAVALLADPTSMLSLPIPIPQDNSPFHSSPSLTHAHIYMVTSPKRSNNPN